MMTIRACKTVVFSFAALFRFLLAGLFFSSLVSGVSAQQVLDYEERLPKDRPEFWAMKLISSETSLTSLGVPRDVRSGAVDAGLEVGWLPALSEEQRLIGFNGTKAENVNRTPILVRPRVSVGLPRNLTFTVGYVPPVPLEGIKPNILGLAVGRPVLAVRPWRLGLRLNGQIGTLRGDITCDRETVAHGLDPVRNPYLCEVPSDDKMTIRSIGMELANGFAVSERLEPYVTVSWNYFSTRFQANARYSGITDRARLVGSGPGFALATGLTFAATPRIRLSAEAFYSPMDIRRLNQPRVADSLLNVRALLTYSLR